MTTQDPKSTAGSLKLIVDDLAKQFHISECLVWSMLGQLAIDERSPLKLAPAVQSEIEKHVLASCLADNEYLFH